VKRLIILIILLLAGCSAADQKEKASEAQEPSPSNQVEKKRELKDDYSFEEFMEDEDVSLKGADIPYRVEERFVDAPFALEGSAQISRYYNYGFEDLEGSHFAVKVTKEDMLDWHVYLPRGEYPDLFKALKKGPVDLYAVASVPRKYYESDQDHLAIGQDVLFKQTGVEEKPLDHELADYMNEHSVELTGNDVLYDMKGMSGRPFALSGNAQLVTYRYASAYKDLEPTHFVLSVRDTVNSDEGLWSIAFDRMKYRELYEQAMKGMVHVNLTAVMPSDRFKPNGGLTAMGEEVEYEPLERYAAVSGQGQIYMEETGLSVTGQEVLYDPISYIGEPFFVEGTAEFDRFGTVGGEYEDLKDTHFRIDIYEDPYGEQYVDYPRAIEGWSLYLDYERYRHIYEKLQKNPYLEVMVTARMEPNRGGAGEALVEDLVIK
jgi:hypothetical protein